MVVGYDARHNSDVFAEDTAAVMAGAGLEAVLLPRPLPTPVLAYAIRKLGCVAGVMVTASHNPPQDNGYKVYLGDGSQIVPPADAEISAAIDAVGALADVPPGRRAGHGSATTVVEAYLDDVGALVDPDGPRDLVTVYTPLHGVGGETVATVHGAGRLPGAARRGRAGRARPGLPDRRVPQPRGARARWTSRWRWRPRSTPTSWSPTTPTPTGARWRCPTRTAGGCCAATRSARCSPTSCSATGAEGVYASSIVSSSLLGTLAAAHGQPHQETLTGFKWIGRVEGLAFGYEEALGYCVAPALVRDKDGVSALLRVVELAARLKAEGRTLTDRLDDIAREHGLLRHRPALGAGHRPRRDRRRDGAAAHHPADRRSAGSRSSGSTTSPTGSAACRPTEGLRYRLADHARVIVRPSGTEPKIKCYLEVVVPVDSAEQDGVDAARISAAGRLDAIRGDLAAAAGL